MRVLLVHQAFVSGDEPGGTRHFEFGQRLARHGDHMTVIASQVEYLSGKSRYPGSRKLFVRERAGDVAVLRAYTPEVLHRGFAWRVVAFITFSAAAVATGLRAGRTDLVMGTSPSLFQAAAAWMIAEVRRKPFLLEVRDLWPEFAIEMGVLRNPVLQRMSRWLEHFLYARADHLMVNSPAYVTYLVEHGVDPDRISFVSNGVDPAMFDPNRPGEPFRREFDIPGNAYVVVYAGAHGPANDLETALAAAERLRDEESVLFVFAGDGKDRSRLEEQARRRELNNVRFLGPLPKSRMADLLAASDACFATLQNIPMFTTTYPNKVFDYMAAGKPTVLAIDGVIREVIEAANGGIFVPPGDSGALARAVRMLATDRAMSRAMGASARDYVVRHFDRDQQAEQFRDVLVSLARLR
jgi:glycosyltransferase involved in cell wall biosynthesis